MTLQLPLSRDPVELLPSTDPIGSLRIDRELPKSAREWGRIIDLSGLKPGDLLLFRPEKAEHDRISSAIVGAQGNGGFLPRHAQWTHAAVYLGDGEHVCEANFGIAGFPNGVIIRSAHNYCDGKTIIRARRPRRLTSEQRLRIAIGALNNLNNGYSFRQAWQFWRASRSGKGFWAEIPKGPKIHIRALVCSTLYQDALTFALKGSTIRMGAFCTPAHLSASNDFEAVDPQLNWLKIE